MQWSLIKVVVQLVSVIHAPPIPRSNLAISGNIFGCYNWKEAVFGYCDLVGRGQNAAKNPVMHGTVLETKDFLAQNISS